jgi:hypothetical protein
MPKIYYQPDLTLSEWEKTFLPSFGVFARKNIAQKAFPGKDILRFVGEEIQEPTFYGGLFSTRGQPKPAYAKG